MYKDISLVFDVDGTLCPIKKKNEEYINLVPDAVPNVDILVQLS